MKKVFAVLVALTLILSCAAMAFAAEGETGKITVTNAIAGETYTIYRIFDLESYNEDTGNYSYKLSEKWESFSAADYFSVDGNGYITWIKGFDDDSADVIAFVELAREHADGVTADGSVVAGENGATFADLPLGYYLVDTSLGTLCAITTTNPDAEVTEKNEGPSLEKKIVEGTDRVDANNVAIGDTVTYEATITVGAGAVNYVMHDKMSAGLDYVGVTSVTVGSVDVDEDYYDVIVDTEDDCTFEITFENDYITGLTKDTKIVVTYTATLNEGAVVGAEGNPNEAWLDYGNAQETTHDFVITYTTKYVVEKVDSNNEPLAGAGFTLFKYDATVTSEDKWVAVGAEQKIETLAEGDDALYTWNGLEAGQYKLVETTVPDGYNKADDITFVITWTAPANVTAGDEDAAWTVNEDAANDVLANDGIFESTVVNNTGDLLPSTGGIGTTIFYIVGIVLMVGACVVLVSKKRMASFA